MMNLPLVPQGAFGVEGALLTALLIGFAFGFALERGGFGNAKKLAAQFYLYDMTVFKVMFTAIIVAMAGLYSFAAMGWVNLDLVWINPTFYWPQILGGFLLGVGFIVSGLCPGTAFVSMASGKTDAFFAIAGIFVGTLVFAFALDGLPFLNALFTAPPAGTLTLHGLLGVPAVWLTVGVVLMALGAFVGAEKVEAIFQKKYKDTEGIERSYVPDRFGKFIMAGSLVTLCVLAGLLGNPNPIVADGTETSPAFASIQALDLADQIIAKNPNLLIMDLRKNLGDDAIRIPGALLAADPAAALPWVDNAPENATILLLAGRFDKLMVPIEWPSDRNYARLEGGVEGWEEDVLTPAKLLRYTSDEQEFVRRQNQISAFFSGAEMTSSVAAPPPPAPSGGKKKKKASGGC